MKVRELINELLLSNLSAEVRIISPETIQCFFIRKIDNPNQDSCFIHLGKLKPVRKTIVKQATK